MMANLSVFVPIILCSSSDFYAAWILSSVYTSQESRDFKLCLHHEESSGKLRSCDWIVATKVPPVSREVKK